MNVQPSAEMAETRNWSGFQNAVINGVYPLQRLLNGSERSAVFLTERKGQADPNAAVKIIPIERVTLAQLSHWRSATGLSHPHLVQLFDAGLCQLGGHQFLFVVMEYAEQTLLQVLSQRALTADEVGEMLPPTLDALTFLHSKGLVQGQLKPANVLVVNDQLKLASDSIRPDGAPRVGIAEPSLYDPPEASHAAFSSAGDMWGLGVTLVEALTQCLPQHDEQSGTSRLPTTVPPAFADTLQRCLSYDPATRPLATDLQTQLGRAPTVPPPIAPTQEPPGQRRLMPAVVAIVFLVLVAAVWADLRLFRAHPNSPQSTAGTDQISSQQPAAVPEVAAQNPTPQLAGPTVLQAQMPNVPRSALRTIRGHIKIAVLVVVDHSGTVIAAHLMNTGPSAYFAGLARQAAKKWTFAPAADQGSRKWLLQFEFTRSGVTGGATPRS